MKLELCSFSGYKIHPGRGRVLVKADVTINDTVLCMGFIIIDTITVTVQRKNPRKIAWTVLYRRKHKKGITTTGAKRRTRRTQKFTRAIEGISKEKILELKNQSRVKRQAARQQTSRKVQAKK
eukprot:gene2310-5295_t